MVQLATVSDFSNPEILLANTVPGTKMHISSKFRQEHFLDFAIFRFLADRTISQAFVTLCRLSVVCLSVCLSVCDVFYCGKTVGLRPSEKLSGLCGQN